MEIFQNLLQTSVLLCCFFLIYHVLLKNDTNYQFKRFYFFMGIVFSAILPWIYFTKTVIVEASKPASVIMTGNTSVQPNIYTQALPEETPVNWMNIFFYAYLMVSIFILFWYLFRYLKIYVQLKKTPYTDCNSYKLHIVSHDVEPFSFCKHIVMSLKDYKSEHSNYILAHEKAHISQWHSLDVMFVNLACACLWFNPIVWMYRTHWVQNLEHIADQAAITSGDKSAYQYLLLNRVLNGTSFYPVKNALFQPFIKQRIMMINKSKTSRLRSLKSLLVLPLLILFVINFQIKVNAQEKKPLRNGIEKNLNSGLDSIKKNNALINKGTLIFAITKNADQEYLTRTKSALKTSYDIDVNYSDIAYNENGELISILVTVDCNDGFKGEEGFSHPNGIENLYMYRDYSEDSKSPFGIGAFSEGEIEKLLSAKDNDGNRYIFSPEGLTTSEKGDIKIMVSSKKKESPWKVNAVLKSVTYSDDVSTTTTNYGNNSNTVANSLSSKKKDPFDVKNYSSKPTFIENNTFVNDSLNKDERVVVKINRFASRDYLVKTKGFLSKRYNIDVNYTNIEYNDEGELISIEATVDCNDGFSASITQKDNSSIYGFYIYRDYSSAAEKPFGLTSNLPSSFKGEKDSNSITYATTVMMTPPVKGFSKINFEDVPQMPNSTTATVNGINLENVKTFIINGETFNLSDISSQFLVVDSYLFDDDETLKVEGELISGTRYFDYLKSLSKDKDEIRVQNLDIILFSNNKATFLNFKDISITQNKSDKK